VAFFIQKARIGIMRKLSGGAARALRLAKLQQFIAVKGAVPLQDAAALLRVSAMTIRRDLAAPGAPLACLGAHVVGSLPATAPQYTLDAERDQHAANKLAACRRAAELVKPGDSLFIDCGTTMPHLAEALAPDIALSIVCYSLNIAVILSRRPNTQLILLGGLFHASAATFFSDESLHYLKRLGIDKAFISAGGVHPRRGVSCSNFNEVAIKQAAMAGASESILVIDDAKLGQLKPAFFSAPAAFSRIVIGGSPARHWRAQFKRVKLDLAA
jgi:DeoR family transcriptional regulator, deoxyribose operon repressor